MKISPIPHNTDILKAEKDIFVLGFDTATQEVRNAIRERLLQPTVTSDIFQKEGKLSEHDLKKMETNLTKPSTVNNSGLKDLDIVNFSQVQDDGYRGQALIHKRHPIHYLKQLKNAGVKRVFDLTLGGYSKYKNDCEHVGLEYHRFSLPATFWLEKSLFETNPRLYINKITEFVTTIQKGNYYIGCDHGVTLTDDALMINQFFNPQNKMFSEVAPHNYEIKLQKLKDICNRLTSEDKQKLGWTTEFEAKTKTKINSTIEKLWHEGEE